ncbi:MAG: hypothetical protein IPO05_17935 [Flavobacteriales bacterium]|nr:hypothetical protein [Flavobacteriales bacterium]
MNDLAQAIVSLNRWAYHTHQLRHRMNYWSPTLAVDRQRAVEHTAENALASAKEPAIGTL